MIVPRTCTEVRAASPANTVQPLKDFRDKPAYVLLGDPGAGKTTAFKRECEVMGDAACFVTARDFVTFKPEDRPEWRRKTLFIDGLDECRAGTPDKRTSFDRIRSQLDRMGKPHFRLSCRAADWLGENDRQHLASVTPQRADVTVLQLEPLTDADVNAVLAGREDVPDPGKFIGEAQERRLEGLLTNPQSLDLLAAAVARNGAWPQSRGQTFEQACRQLAAEHNQEHRHAQQTHEVDETLDAAGRLCAMLLITGRPGFAADPDYANGDYLNADHCTYEPCDRQALRTALATNLFATEAEGRFAPMHRHVAEFLGARYLAQCIDKGVPARRVLSLITGEDGGVVTQLRGLAAWLAALCSDSRPELIGRDPIGVVSYGDVHGFTISEKRLLLMALKQEGARLERAAGSAGLGRADWVAPAVGSLVTKDMAPVLRDALTPPIEDFFFAKFVLLALVYGTPLPDLAEFLFDLACKRHRWLQLPRMALKAFLHNCPDESTRDRKLKQLLDYLHCGQVSDWDSELLSTVLTELYPRRVTASEIWIYLTKTHPKYSFFPSDHFWRHHLIEQSSVSDIEILLDELTTRRGDLTPELRRLEMTEVPLGLLARGIEQYGDKLSAERLHSWLGLDIDPYRQGVKEEAARRRIGSWLEQHPDKLKDAIAETARPPTDPAIHPRFQVDKISYGAKLPPDYGLWCLQQAVATTSLPWIDYFLRHVLARKKHDRGLTMEVIFERTRNVPEAKQVLDKLLADPIDETSKLRNKQRRYIESREMNRRRWITYVRSKLTELRTGTCAPDVLERIAEAYYGTLLEVTGDSSEERIRDLFQDENPLIEAAYSGIVSTPNRDDLPEVDEIIELAGSGKIYRLSLPFLAALELDHERRLSGRQAMRALAFHYSSSTAVRRRTMSRGWYRTLLARNPETVADVLVKCVSAALRNGSRGESIFDGLFVEDSHADVARNAVVLLLRSFPLRCTVPQLESLDHLLHDARRYVDGRHFRELITERLSHPSMSVAQRVRWLAIGVIAAPDTYLDHLRAFVQRREKRISHLAEFLEDRRAAIGEMTEPALKYLIGLLGSTVGRFPKDDSDLHPASSASIKCVFQMIQQLAITPEPEAGSALDELASDAALASWRDTLTSARDRQRVIRRDACYRHPSVAQVRDMLSNGPPANAGDLAALIADRLDEIASRIRTRNTDDWRQYWNVDRYERPCNPKPENSCRDALLSDLQQFLPPEVDALPEGTYAAHKRADVRVSCRGFNVPIETKRSGHPDLWQAIRRQLIEQYASDPRTEGFGIYLVFWFEPQDTPRAPGGAVPPDSPEALRQQLEATLTEDERRRISVRVIDVSAPTPSPSARPGGGVVRGGGGALT